MVNNHKCVKLQKALKCANVFIASNHLVNVMRGILFENFNCTLVKCLLLNHIHMTYA